MSFVIGWLVVILGIIAIGVFIFSGRSRRRLHFFISTHFYINKYEYRDEWLALSQNLRGALTGSEVVEALKDVLNESLYTSQIFFWLAGPESPQGYELQSTFESAQAVTISKTIQHKDSLARYLQKNGFFYLKEAESTSDWRDVLEDIEKDMGFGDLVLFSSISVGDQLLGIIGLGPEFTGGQYGHDDFDLLTALGSQAGAALLAVNRAEQLAQMREQQAWNRLSSFVLHDIKNAATMLSLLRENAAEHIHEPEFQKDMLESVDDALVRMGRVEKRLNTLEETMLPNMQQLDLHNFLYEIGDKFEKKIPMMKVELLCEKKIVIFSDRVLLSTVFENLLLNAFEAKTIGDPVVWIVAQVEEELQQAVVTLTDNGDGIIGSLLPEALFEPFKTTRSGGSGIGLWQVRMLVKAVSGTITAHNTLEVGAQFVLKLPMTLKAEEVE